jgi:hypothetical protein
MEGFEQLVKVALEAELLEVLKSKTYFDDPVIVTLKALAEGVRQAQRTSLQDAVNTLHEVLGLPRKCVD